MNPTYKQLLEEKIDAMDKELEALFNLAGLSFTAYIGGKINEEERNALLADWNEEAKVHYHTLASSIRSSVLAEVRSKVIGKDDTTEIPFTIITPDGGLIHQNIARNELRASQRTTLDEMEAYDK